MRAFSLLFLVLLAPNVHSQGGLVSVSVLDPNVQFPTIPDISGRSVVFLDYRNFAYGIYHVDIVTGIEQMKVPIPLFAEAQVRISENRFVWIGYPNTTQADVYSFNLQTSQTLRLTNNVAFQNYPDIHGNRVVWQDYRNAIVDTFNADIYMYDFSTGQEFQIVSNPSYQSFPAIWGSRIVWQDYRNAHTDSLNADIYLYDLSTSIETQITTNPSYQTFPSIWENRIVWEDFRNGTGDIYMYDLSTQTERPISTYPAYKTRPVIYRNWIIWQDYRNGTTQGEIFGYHLGTEQEYPLVVQTDHQDLPCLDSNNVVWQDFRNSRFDLYLGVLSGNTTVTLGVPVAQHWNIVSLPVSSPVPDDSVRHLYENSINPYAFAYTNGYIQRFTMSNGPGYWVKSSASYTQSITGTRRDTLTIPVSGGWNMIGSISTSIDTSAAHVTPSMPGLQASNYYSYAAGYQVAATIFPGTGYWVKANMPGSFFMHVTAPGKASTGTLETHRTIYDLNTLTIQDAGGGSQTLYFGTDPAGQIPAGMFGMPPVPPRGLFDARFESTGGGTMVQTHLINEVELPISIQSNAYPLTVSWKVDATDVMYQLGNGMGDVHTMRGEGTLTISNKSVNRLVVRVTVN